MKLSLFHNLKGLVSDSKNIVLRHESEDINKKTKKEVISKISVDSNFMFTSHA